MALAARAKFVHPEPADFPIDGNGDIRPLYAKVAKLTVIEAVELADRQPSGATVFHEPTEAVEQRWGSDRTGIEWQDGHCIFLKGFFRWVNLPY